MEKVVDFALLDRILAAHGYKASSVVTVLQDIQKVYRYLPKEVFPYIAEKLDVSKAHLFAVATFYENFSLEPKGKYIIKVCDGTACHVRKSTDILNTLRQELKLSAEKQTTDDLNFTVETVSCLGACGLAPVITVNEKVHGAMTPEKTKILIDDLRTKVEAEAKA